MPRLKHWFVREGRLRSGWRIALYLIAARLLEFIGSILFGLALGFVLVSQGVPQSALRAHIAEYFLNPFHFPAVVLSLGTAHVLLILAVIWIFRWRIDKRPVRDLGFQLTVGWWRELIAGFVFVVIAWGVIFVLSLALGAATIVDFQWGRAIGALTVGLMFNLMVGIAEEADARGYILQNLAEGIRFWPAVVVSSIYFGALHLLNPGAGILSTLGIFFAGVLLAMGYYLTRRLWFPIGMHAAWNFAEGPVFGFPVSGLNMGGMFQLNVTGPEWLMGGPFGPEAGALAVSVEIAMIVILFVWARQKATQP